MLLGIPIGLLHKIENVYKHSKVTVLEGIFPITNESQGSLKSLFSIPADVYFPIKGAIATHYTEHFFMEVTTRGHAFTAMRSDMSYRTASSHCCRKYLTNVTPLHIYITISSFLFVFPYMQSCNLSMPSAYLIAPVENSKVFENRD